VADEHATVDLAPPGLEHDLLERRLAVLAGRAAHHDRVVTRKVGLAPKHALSYGHRQRIGKRPARGNARRPGGRSRREREGRAGLERGVLQRFVGGSILVVVRAAFGVVLGIVVVLVGIGLGLGVPSPATSTAPLARLAPRLLALVGDGAPVYAFVVLLVHAEKALGKIRDGKAVHASHDGERLDPSAVAHKAHCRDGHGVGQVFELRYPVLDRQGGLEGRRLRLLYSCSHCHNLLARPGGMPGPMTLAGWIHAVNGIGLVRPGRLGVRWETMDDQPWLLALVVAAAVQGIRDRVRRMDGWVVVGCALACSVALVLGLDEASPLPSWAKQSLVVFVLSVGGASTVKAVGRKIWGVSNKGDTGGNHG